MNGFFVVVVAKGIGSCKQQLLFLKPTIFPPLVCPYLYALVLNIDWSYQPDATYKFNLHVVKVF